LLILKNSLIYLLFNKNKQQVTNKYFLINNQLNYKSIINKIEKKINFNFKSEVNLFNLKYLQQRELLLKKKLNLKLLN
jgi:hypothetical protein